jgi:hypothetical protein
MTKLPYSESSVFLVPLRNGGYARGVVARSNVEGRILLGYFFGPRLASTNEVALEDLEPSSTIHRVRCGDLGLVKGEWQIVGTVSNWDRSKWPMPEFIRRDDLSKKAWLVRYSDNNPNRIETEFPVEFDSDMPRDSVSGYGAVEITLTRLLSERRNESERGNDQPDTAVSPLCISSKHADYPIHHYLYFPDKLIGERVANVLRLQGYIVDDRLGADDVNWVLLVKSNAVPTSVTIGEQRRLLEQTAKENNGQYDGWEADVEGV